MIRSIHTVNRNMNILQKKQENSSANIANINTAGYKFQDIVQSTLESKKMINYAGGSEMNKRQELGDFVYGNQIDEVYTDFQQGSLYETRKATDFAIVGRGFFTVQLDDGRLAYTRNGNFRLNEQKQLVTMDGYPVLGVDKNDQTSYIYADDDEINPDISLLISDFDDYNTLNAIGSTVYISDAPNNPIEGEVKQFFLESSNVSMADELVKMIEISREFESNQKLMHAADETLNKAVNEVGRV